MSRSLAVTTRRTRVSTKERGCTGGKGSGDHYREPTRTNVCGSPEGVRPFACEAVCVSARERAAVCDDMEIQKHAEALRKH